jgi:predicted 2-oxoglutarate/Fe(II)-dependent dioxygenase YbiX
MTVTAEAPPDGGPPARTIMPPYLVLPDFLDATSVAALIDFTLAHEDAFAPTMTGHGEHSQLRPNVRVSFSTRDLGPIKPMLVEKLRPLVPELVRRLRVTDDLRKPKFEFELVAHNDGAFYRRHIDTQTAAGSETLRILSGVYYFHAQPKGFTGGALRLLAIGGSATAPATFVDVEPAHNTLLVFPSWAPHEVRPVICPSKRFADSRFAINCWVRRAAVAAAPKEALPGP